MSDKGNTYYCTWKKNDDGDYVGWHINRPSLRGEGMTRDEMVSELGGVIAKLYNDQEAALNFDPPLEIDEDNKELFADDLVQTGWNAGFRYSRSTDTAFTGGRCNACGGGIGPRSNTPLIIDDFPEGADGAASAIGGEISDHNMPGAITIVSEAFLSLLTSQEREYFSTRPVVKPKSSRRIFHEIVPQEVISPVALPNLSIAGWRCSVCNRRTFSHGKDLGWGTDIVSRDDLKAVSRTLFFAGNQDGAGMCMSRSRYRELTNSRRARKVTCSPLGVIDEHDAERNPDLPTLEELYLFRRKYGFTRPFSRDEL